MTSRAEAAKQHVIDRIAHLGREAWAGRTHTDGLSPETVELFIRQLYQGLPPEDLAQADAENLYGAAVSLLLFARQRLPQQTRLRVYNPRIEEHGWQCEHTVVEIVQEDMPFLVDSVVAALAGMEAQAVRVSHPVLAVHRTAEGILHSLSDQVEDGSAESIMHLYITEISDPQAMQRLTDELLSVLAENRAAVEDWRQICQRVRGIQAELATPCAPAAPCAEAPLVDASLMDAGEDLAALLNEDRSVTGEFLSWLLDNHFTLLGYRHHSFHPTGSPSTGRDQGLTVSLHDGLGILRDPKTVVFHELQDLAGLPAEVMTFLNQPTHLLITKANKRARVHRAVHLDMIGIKQFAPADPSVLADGATDGATDGAANSPSGRVVGLHMLVGLFTSNVYTNSASFVPVLQRKVERVLKRTGVRPHSHDGKRLLNILENLPRDELFQASEDKLLEMSLRILHLQERQHTALLVRQDEFERFVSCLVFVPRDRYDTALRLVIRDILQDAFRGTLAAYYTQVADSPLARLHFILKTTPGRLPAYDVAVIEDKIALAARAWSDHLGAALVAAKGEEQGLRLGRRYAEAFPSAYRERQSALAAVYDIDRLEDTTLAALETVSEASSAPRYRLSMNLYRPLDASDGIVRFKLYHPHHALPLSDVLPMLENMGLRVVGEEPFEVRPLPDRHRLALLSEAKGAEVTPVNSLWIHDFSMTLDGGGAGSSRVIEIARVREAFHQAFARVWSGEAENDGFNRLVLLAGLTWREVVILRAYARYLRQAAFTFSQASIEATLAAHPDIAKGLVALFHARFSPDGSVDGDSDLSGNPSEKSSDKSSGKAATSATAQETSCWAEVVAALDRVSNPDEDRILRRYLNLITSTLRTNYYQQDATGAPKAALSFKIDSRRVEDLPLPRPMVEVWVYSPRVEAIHLRGGKVARGGIRWSDRREDFRTEILGLIKAQMVKNAVIVPVGSKGGFVVKRPPTSGGREAFLAEGIDCYKIFMRGLLDLTDNIGSSTPEAPAGVVVPPPRVRRHDGDDPYLVVAADKGTATFSDIANGISADYGFWLGDAFASGGSQGYDHKAMGITARGAWEAVKRHFREMPAPQDRGAETGAETAGRERLTGWDIQRQPFTVVGVGDMSGDVFGNGMLLSRQIRLQAAFNHQHIFLDPDPDPLRSWEERQRLFRLPRSSWADYAPEVISVGGGVYERQAKKIPLSPQVKPLLLAAGETLDALPDEMPPNEVIRRLLMAPVDLLWFGGIGTYLRAADETDGQVGDRANDAVRIAARDVRAKVIGEGANLGVTQRARIEYALRGGRINTDAIDNSAGVDCSDHEVNIKILLNALVMDGDMTLKQRNLLLAEMTDDVAALVLRDNYLQTQAMSMIQWQGIARLDHQARLTRVLEKSGRLNRAVEFLPDEERLSERMKSKTPLTRPEMAVLIAYTKMWVFDEILASSLPDDDVLLADLVHYFPQAVQLRFASAISHHRLRREIIATHAANSMINRVGGTFVTQIMEKTGMPVPEIARAYLVVRDAFALRDVWAEIEALDAVVPAAIQYEMLFEVNKLLERGTLWVLRHAGQPFDMGRLTADLAGGQAMLAGSLTSLCSSGGAPDVAPDVAHDIASRRARYLASGVPAALAERVAEMVALASVPDMVRLSQDLDVPLVAAAGIYLAVGARLSLGWLRGSAEKLTQNGSHWDKLAVAAVVEDLYADQREIASAVIRRAGDPATVEEQSPADLVTRWACGLVVERADQLLGELRSTASVDLAMLTVVSRQMGLLRSV